MRTLLITGAASGIGAGIAHELAAAGHHVIVSDLALDAAEATAADIRGKGGSAEAVALDVTSDDSVAAALAAISRPVDVLVNNAGVFLDIHGSEETGNASVFNASLETLTATLKTNLFGPLLLAQELVPLMKQQHYGRIVNISSGMGQLSEMEGRSPAYRISKTALNALTRILAAETQGFNILVNSVCPGWVRTDMGGPQAERSIEQGAAGIVWAATLPDDGPSGGFFRDGQPIPW